MKRCSKFLSILLVALWPLFTLASDNVPYLSGGIGDEELATLRARKAEFNVQLLFAEKGSGSYVADVKLEIRNAGGPVLSLDSAGPLVLAKLAPGRYWVTAESSGKVQSRQFNVRKGQPGSANFYW